MFRKNLIFLMVMLVLTVIGLSQNEVKNPNTIIVARTANVNTLDPHYLNDQPSIQAVFNIYEQLVRFKGESPRELKPVLATVVPSIKNGLIAQTEEGGVIYDFPIRKGVYFHKVGVRQKDGSIAWKDYDSLSEVERANIVPGYGELTPEDVKYSFLRSMIQDRSGGVSRDLLKALTGYGSIEALAKDIAGVDDFSKVDETSLIKTFEVLDRTIAVKGHIVEFHLPKPYPTFWGNVIANPGQGAILDKEWVIAQGGWPGTAESWKSYHDPAKEEDVLYSKANGTGPFKLKNWDRVQKTLTLERFDGYWGGVAKIKNVVRKVVPEWSTRKLMLQAGDADIIDVSRAVVPQLEGMESVHVEAGPELALNAIFFQWEVAKKDNIGSGKLDGEGIPPDFFSHLNVRKGFVYAFDYKTYSEQVLQGWGYMAPCPPLLKGQLGCRADSPRYHHDPEKAVEYFKKAYDGKLWKVGFKFTAFAPTGMEEWKTALELLRDNLSEINPKFRMDVQVVQWSTFLDNIMSKAMPLYIVYLGPGYTLDPAGMVRSYMASDGLTAAFQGTSFVSLAKEKFDPLIKEAEITLDPTKRASFYAQLAKLAYDYAINIFLDRPMDFQALRDWVKGFYFSPLYTTAVDFHALSKGY